MPLSLSVPKARWPIAGAFTWIFADARSMVATALAMAPAPLRAQKAQIVDLDGRL
jgi:hypothetical protein